MSSDSVVVSESSEPVPPPVSSKVDSDSSVDQSSNVDQSSSVELADGSTPTSSTDTSTPVGDSNANNREQQVNLLDIPVDSEHAALNIIVGFLGVAQRRGCFAMNESAKIYECIKVFQPKNVE